MYVFLSHSSRDMEFVNCLANSLAFHGVPIFFDEHDIKVGDNIPTKIYKGLEQATHVVYVLSKNSIKSEWVVEELSVAKMRQMANLGCRILPILIGNVSPPPNIAHIKYTKFKNWKVKENYQKAFQELLTSLDIKTDYTSSIELAILEKHLNDFIKIEDLVRSAYQTFSQINKYWELKYNTDHNATFQWLIDTISKEWDISNFKQGRQAFEMELSGLGSPAEKIQKILNLSNTLENDYLFFLSFPSLSAIPEKIYFDRIWKSQLTAIELLDFITLVLKELEGYTLS